MKRSSLNNLRDVLALLVRRKAWILVPFITLSLAIALLTYLLPKVYVSESLILIQPRGVPEELVKDLIAGTTEQRLSSIEKTVLSRTNLLLILDEFERQLPEVRGLNVDQKVLKLKDQIGVAFEAERRTGVPLTYFRISYQNRNPALAQQIASKLTSLFIEQDIHNRGGIVSGSVEFFSGELAKVAEQLRQSDARLAELKRQHMHELPGQLETSLRTLDRLNLQKQANAEALDRSATLRLNLEKLIADTPPLIAKETPTSKGTSPVSVLVETYRKKELEYRTLLSKYTSSHPDVQRAKAELERLKKGIPAEELVQLQQTPGEAPPPPVMVSNPAYQNLTAQLRELATEFEIREREKKWIESEIAKYSDRVQNTPAREQDMATVLRANGELTKQYQDLKDKLSQAKLSQSLESGSKGSQFLVVDPANYPLLPAKPNKLAVVFAGTGLSLLVGICLATAVDLLNQKIWTQTEIEHNFDVPVLAEIPEIVTDADVSLTRKKRLAYAALSVVFGTAYLGCLYFIYLKQIRVLNLLDPIIQKLIYT